MEYSSEDALKNYRHYLEKYIEEVNRTLTPERLIQDMMIFPVVFDGDEIGIVGINTSDNPPYRTAILRIIYLEKAFRGGKFGPIMDGLFQTFKDYGFTHTEGWVYPDYAKHVAKRYDIEPKILVFHEPLDSLLSKIPK